MKLLNALLAAALMGVSLGAVAHEGEGPGKKKAGPGKKDQARRDPDCQPGRLARQQGHPKSDRRTQPPPALNTGGAREHSRRGEWLWQGQLR